MTVIYNLKLTMTERSGRTVLSKAVCSVHIGYFRALRNRMLSSLQYSRKKVNEERFTPVNMIYTQKFIDYLHSKDPRNLKFCDEAGLKLPHHGARYYEHAPVGQRCIELAHYHETSNVTLNLLVGLDGVLYAIRDFKIGRLCVMTTVKSCKRSGMSVSTHINQPS